MIITFYVIFYKLKGNFLAEILIDLYLEEKMKQKNKALFVAGSAQVAEGLLPVAEILSEKADMDIIFIDSLSYSGVEIEKAVQKAFPVHKITEYSSNNAYDILKTEKPKILIVPDDFSIVERAFVKASKKLGIPSVLVIIYNIFLGEISAKHKLARVWKLIHRLKFYVPRYSFLINTLMKINKFGEAVITPPIDLYRMLTKCESLMLGKFGCTKILVPSHYQKEVFKLKGIRPNRIEVVGNIYFEKLISKRKFSKTKKILSRLNLKPSKKFVLFATSDDVGGGTWSKTQQKINFRTVLNAVKKINNTELVVSIHPKEEIETYRGYLEKDEKGVIVTDELPTLQLIPICDAFIANYSTITLFALLNKKPCIMLNLFGDLPSLPVVDRGAALEARSGRELASAIKMVLRDRRSRQVLIENGLRFLEEYQSSSDEGLDEQILNILSSLVR